MNACKGFPLLVCLCALGCGGKPAVTGPAAKGDPAPPVVKGDTPLPNVETPVTKTPATGGTFGAGFHPLTFDQALTKAKAENKLVMVNFFSKERAPSNEMDDTTWRDPKVQNWLNTKTVAIRSDFDKQVKFAEKYSVSRVPTMIFFNERGQEAERVIGPRNVEDFLREANDILNASR